MEPVDYFLLGIFVMALGVAFVMYREAKRDESCPYRDPWGM
jgi:hypothetical protein